MGGYTASIRMERFAGLFQEGDGIGTDIRYAIEAINVETEGGVLASAAKNIHLQAELSQPIGTLMRLHRRWHAGESEKDILIAASEGQLYWTPLDGTQWHKLQMPGDREKYICNEWSWVTYEVNPEGTDAPVDVLLLSNAEDGMICIYGNDMSVSAVQTPKKFGVIARYAERIWGGAIADDPDTLLYSAPFDPFCWEQNNEIPEDGAGDVMQPSWDGDSFVALTQFGAQLIAFKRNRVWRILGTDPGSYVFREQYGAGMLAKKTMAIDGERIWMLGKEGLMRYDGLSVEPFGKPFAKQIFERINPLCFEKACACMYKGRYYCALPLDGALQNNAVLMYNTNEQTWLLRDRIMAEAFLPTENALFYTSATEPGRVWRWGEDAQKEGAVGSGRWVSPWIDLGDPYAWKGGWTVYAAPEADAPMQMRITIRTEKRARTKKISVSQGGKLQKLVFGGAGKKFRLEIESCGSAAWRMIGGIHMDVEVDPV